MVQHPSSFLRRARTAVTAAVLTVAAIGPVVGLAGPAAAATTFSNSTALTVADAQPPCTSGCTPGVASSYPSNIVVSGLSGTLSAMTVTLSGVTHAFTGDLGVLLVGPAGQKFVVASDSGNNAGSSGATITFDDAAPGVPAESAGWGSGSHTYKPFNYSDDPDSWPGPAPAGPYSNADNGSSGSGSLSTATFASVFNGTNPNGTWSLYVVDDGQGDTGTISGGWSLSLTTAAAAATATTVTSSANPSGTGASVTFTAHVAQSSDSSAATSGTVTFTDGATVLGSGIAVTSGVAVVSTSALAEGTHTITANYTGNATYGNSTGTVTQVVDHPTTQSGGTYCNSGPITINDASIAADGTATPYPSHIVITGASGGLSSLKVNLKGVTATFADDLDVELVGPGGQAFMLASDAGGPTAIAGADVTFDDGAGTTFAQSSGGWGSGTSTSRPVDYNSGTDAMPAPAPAGWSSAAPTGAATLTTVFGGAALNGTWSLYVADDAIDGHTGSIASGWCLNTVSTSDAATTTSVTSSVNPTALGGSTTFTAHVVLASDASNVTSGSVTFRDGNTVVSGPTALNGSGLATFTTAALTEGSHTITAAYGGVGGSFNLSSGTVTQVVNGVTTVSANTFCNNGGITVNDPPGSGVGSASPYASHLVVSGVGGNLLSLTATLKGVTHAAPDDLDVLLVGPGGQAVKLVSDAGGLVGVSNVNATFSDAAGSLLPDSSSWGSGSITVKPTDYNDGVDTFPAPAPGSPGTPAPAGSATLNGTFAGTSPNGTWSLYVVDDSLGQTGSMTGWCITMSIPAAAADDSYSAAKNTTLTVGAPGVLGNDTGYPAPTVTASDSSSAHGGTVSVGADGHFSYVPPAGFTGDDTFAYTAGNGATSVGTVTVHVTNVPVVSGSTISRQQGSPATSATVATVSDVETPAGSLVVGTGSSSGITLTALANTAGTVTASVGAACTAAPNAHTLSVSATDTDGFTGSGTLTVDVSANTPPALAYNTVVVNAGGATASAPFAAASDNGTVTALAVPTVPSGFTGTITIDDVGTGTPGTLHVSNAGPSGNYLVGVKATDNCGASTTAFVGLTVNGAPTVDAGADDSDTIFVGPYTLNGTASDDARAPGGALVTTWSKVSGPGTVSFDDVHSLTAQATFGTGGVYVLQLSATDGQLTSTDTVQITANDQPTITVPADITVAEPTPGAGAAVPFSVTGGGYPASTVTCEDSGSAVHSGDTFAAGVHTIICVADNGFGSAGGTFTITVTAGPVITVPADITVTEASPGAGAAVPFTVTATGTPTPVVDCVEGASPVHTGDTFAAGAHTITCTAANSSGTDTKSFHITVRSVPVISVPSDFSIAETPAGSGHGVVTWTTSATGFPTPTIACFEGATPVSSGDTFAVGAHTIHCVATNAAGTDSGSFVATVTAGPVVTVPADITVDESAPGAGKAVPFTVTASGVPTPSISCVEGATPVSSGDTFAAGSHSISCTATNASGSDTKSFHIVVRSVPVISVPADFSVLESPAGSGHAVVTWTTSATGFPAPAITCIEGATAVASGDTFTAGAHTISCTATNAAGSDSGSFVVTVKAGPVVSVPADITVTESSAGAGKAVAFAVTATGVPAPLVTCKDGAATVHSGDSFAAGVHTVSCTATNAVGSDSKSFTITVQSLPVLTVPASFSAVESPVGSGTAVISFAAAATGTPTPVTVCKIGAAVVTSPATLAIGSHQIDCVARNVVGSDSGSFTVTVTAGNRAPTAAAGGPYAVAEGQPVHLDGSGSSDPDGDTLTYSWDVNGDGTFTDATGAAPVLSWSQLSALGVSDGPGTFHPQVRLSDGKAAAVTSTATTLTVVNTAPVTFIGGTASAAGGLKVTLVFSATDPSVPDQQAGFSYLVHWGDGTSNGPVHGGDAWSGTHTYAAAGSYAVTVTATDKDGAASDPATRTIAVTSRVTDICGTGKTLFVGGSAGDDVITVRPGAVDGTVAVVVDGVAQTVPSGFARLVVRAGAGNDSVTVTGLSSVRRMLYGEAGDDVLSGGGGPSVLVGGDGRDTLAGGSARDVIIGGAGVDIATGGAGDDLLIDGATAWDAFGTANEKALCGIQAEWTRTDASFPVRVAHLLGGKGSLSTVHFILKGPHRNVFSGGDKDLLDGGSGWNWFLCNVRGKGVQDRVRRLAHDRVSDL